MPAITITAPEAVLEAIQASLEYNVSFWVDMLDDSYGIDREIGQEWMNEIEIKEY